MWYFSPKYEVGGVYKHWIWISLVVLTVLQLDE